MITNEYNIYKIHAWTFFKYLLFPLPIFVIYFQSYNISYFQMMIILAGQAIFNILFEVPSGIFSDYYGRKNSLIISSILKVISSLLYFSGNNTFIFFIASALFGISKAFESGSDSALIYDTLRDMDDEKSFKKISGRNQFFLLSAMGIAAFIGGIIANTNIKLTFILAGIAAGISVIISLFIEEPQHRKESDYTHYFDHLSKATTFVWNHRQIKYLIIFSAVMIGIMETSHRFFQPYLIASGVNISIMGLLYLGFLLFSALVSKYAYLIEKIIGEFNSLLIIPLLLGLQFLFMGRYIHLVGISFIFIGEFVWGFIKPIVGDMINKQVESNNRATILSFSGFIQSLILILLSPFFGHFADYYGLDISLIFLGITVIIMGSLILLRLKQVSKKISHKKSLGRIISMIFMFK